MAVQNNDPAGGASSAPLNGNAAAELDDDYYEYDENDPEMLDPQSREDAGYLEGEHDFRFKKLNELIQARITEPAATIRPDKPYNNVPSRELHNKQQRVIWQRIREEANNDDGIPTALFSPPRTYIEVCVSEWPRMYHYCCPCDIADTACEVIKIRAPRDSKDGITKDMFIQQVSEAFYGRDTGEGNEGEGDGYRIGGEDDRPVIDNFDYMIQGSSPEGKANIMGHIFALTRGIVPDPTRGT
ncbi:hypothetical protein F5Y13DRAFT_124184 [Hypoxylon sp. FL1857]|nr:hypothetical protein F5Y13DRAFT_124184 [Hypoxylon sp. FL1857]